MAAACFVCNEMLNGDAAFVEHHVNRCLDAAAGGPAPHRKERSPPPATADALLAQSLADEFDAQAALALEYDDAMQLERVDPDRSPDGAAPGCPACESSWDELGIRDGNEAEMVRHVAECLDGKAETSRSSGNGDDDGPFHGGFGRGSGSKELIGGRKGVIQVLQTLLCRSHKDGRIISATLCSTSIEHIKTELKDWGWGCGYRNMMMIFSSLRHMESYANLGGKGKGPMPIPSILEFQTLVEEAWQHGYDQDGAKHFKHKLCKSKKWIGTTEVYTGLTWLGIRVRIIDFPKTRGNDGVHYALIRWIKSYFESPLDPAAPSSSTSKKRSSSPPPSAHERLMASNGSAVCMSKKQPLYLQHDGHSRTVVGIEINKSGEWLIIFDPSKSPSQSVKDAAATHSSPDSNKRAKPFSSPASSCAGLSIPASFLAAAPGHEQIWNGKGKLGNLVSVWPSSSGSGPSSPDLQNYGKHLEPFRVNLRNLSRKDQYQILYVEEGPMLTAAEKSRRKMVPAEKVVK